jgi:hypothetical protein
MLSWTSFLAICIDAVDKFCTGLNSTYKEKAKEDIKQFLNDSKDYIQELNRQYENGLITKRQYKTHIKGRFDVAQMLLLKQNYSFKMELDKFITSLKKSIVDAIILKL